MKGSGVHLVVPSTPSNPSLTCQVMHTDPRQDARDERQHKLQPTCITISHRHTFTNVYIFHQTWKIFSFSADFSFFLLLKFTHFLSFSAQFELFYLDFKSFFSCFEHFQCFWQKDIFRSVSCSCHGLPEECILLCQALLQTLHWLVKSSTLTLDRMRIFVIISTHRHTLTNVYIFLQLSRPTRRMHSPMPSSLTSPSLASQVIHTDLGKDERNTRQAGPCQKPRHHCRSPQSALSDKN